MYGMANRCKGSLPKMPLFEKIRKKLLFFGKTATKGYLLK